MSVPEPVIGEPLAESAIAAPPTIDVPATHEQAQSRSVVGVRGWLLTAFLFLVPLVAYWPATFHDYGLRDDYSNLREAHEEPGKIMGFCASHARPIYGWLLQSTYGQTSSVQDLQWMRFGASLLLGALSLVSSHDWPLRHGETSVLGERQRGGQPAMAEIHQHAVQSHRLYESVN